MRSLKTESSSTAVPYEECGLVSKMREEQRAGGDISTSLSFYIHFQHVQCAVAVSSNFFHKVCVSIFLSTQVLKEIFKKSLC